MLIGATILLVGILVGLYIPTPRRELLKKSFDNAIYKTNKKATVVDMTESYDPENEIYPTS